MSLQQTIERTFGQQGFITKEESKTAIREIDCFLGF